MGGFRLAQLLQLLASVSPVNRLFRNLTKEVRMYASKFIDKGRVSMDKSTHNSIGSHPVLYYVHCLLWLTGLQLGAGYKDEDHYRWTQVLSGHGQLGRPEEGTPDKSRRVAG